MMQKILMSLLLLSCGASPDLSEDSPGPGTAKLNCTGAKLAGPEMDIVLPDTSTIELNCSGLDTPSDYFGEVPLTFQVEQPKRPLPAESMPGPTNGGPETPLTPAEPRGTLVGGVSFQVTVYGQTADLQNTIDGSTPDPSIYHKGISTPQSSWCTDTGGTGTVNIVPKCLSSTNTVLVQISGGGMKPKMFTITTKPSG